MLTPWLETEISEYDFESDEAPDEAVNWDEVVRWVLCSRALDDIEEKELLPSGQIRLQFSARGHELSQVLLGLHLNHPHDAAAVYYRSRPLMLTQGLTLEEAVCGSMGRMGGLSDGRDIGVVFNLPARERATVLPMSGDVGGQYTPAVGWAQAIQYHSTVLHERAWQGALVVAHGGDGSTAASGFWAALNIASSSSLPMLFFIEDNGYAISVPSAVQTPDGDLLANLASFKGIQLLDGDGTMPSEAIHCIQQAVQQVRAGHGPVLLRLRVPRLNGHSAADNQNYKDETTLMNERLRDPLPRLRQFLYEHGWTETRWATAVCEAESEVRQAVSKAQARPSPEPAQSTHFVYADVTQPQQVGGQAALSRAFSTTESADVAGPRVNMIDAIRQTLMHELKLNPRMVVFGEDVGRKGGVHGATRDLQKQFGAERVYDTSLNEEGIIGRAVGMAYAGLLPVPEIQFRKYADPAMEQLNDCGTIRWRTANRFAAPIVVRMPVGFGKSFGDPWHSVCSEATFAHMIGWQIAYPSNAADAVGLLRTALRGNDPVFFLEPRALLDTPSGRASYPGDDYVLPFGRASVKQRGDTLTVVTWGTMVSRCLEAAQSFGERIEILDLRTLMPWDQEAVLESVRKTGRCLIVHEDTWTGGFGGEIAAVVAAEAFEWLDAPIARIASANCPVPYSPALMSTVVPTMELIRSQLERLLRY